MTIRFHDPGAQPVRPIEPYALATSLGPGVTVGLLANSFLDCDHLIDAMREAISKLRPEITLRTYRKDTTSPAPQALLAAITSQCDAAVVAIGH